MKLRLLAVAAAFTVVVAGSPAFAESKPADYKGPLDILNVSYDLARELYAQINPVFIEHWKKTTGQTVEIKQSHGGSSKQARSILEGLQADIVTFNQVTDIQVLHDKGNLVRADWAKAYPNGSSPYYSLPAFLVRKGNPKHVKDWDDLIRKDVQAVFPNPKTSGNGRYTYLAAYAYALGYAKGDQEKTKAFVKTLLGNVPVFDTGGRGATTTFVEREVGDVLITFEAEVHGIQKEYGVDKFEVVIPSQSLLAEFPVAVIDKVVDQRGSRALAEDYLKFLWSPEAQDVLARNWNRVRDDKVAAKYAGQFPKVNLVTIDSVFGGWDQVQKVHFAEGGVLDQVFEKRQ